MNKVHVLLTPEWNKDKIDQIWVKIILKGAGFKDGEVIFGFHQDTVGVPFLDLSREVRLEDADGELGYATSKEQIPKIRLIKYRIMRKTRGDIEITYQAKLKPVGKNPAFDLGYEDGGMSGSGMSFMPFFAEGQYEYVLDWDLARLPEGFRGIWSLGEGRVEIIKQENILTESFYYAGDIMGLEKEGCGFYWLKNHRLPGEEVGRFVTELFGKMAAFFHDQKEPYHVFSRKIPEALTGRNKIGGLALTRSFLYLYPMENPPGEKTLKFLFPHEMVHNWPKLVDEPFGTCTWYVEGTAEYYSVVLPDRYGMLTREELTAQLNKRARDYYENPRIAVTNEFAGENLFIDSEATLIPYGRGFFYLLKMDQEIRNATNGIKSLDDVVLAVLSRTRAGEKCGNDTWLEEVKKAAGLDISQEFEEMCRGRFIAPCTGSFVTPVEVIETKGVQRETGHECVLYQFV